MKRLSFAAALVFLAGTVHAQSMLSVTFGPKNPVKFLPSDTVTIPCAAPPGTVVATMLPQQGSKSVSSVTMAPVDTDKGPVAGPAVAVPDVIVQGNSLVVGPQGVDQTHCGQTENLTVAPVP